MSYIQNPVQVITRKTASPDRKIQIDYPLVLGIPNPPVQKKINATIINLINSMITQQAGGMLSQYTMQVWYEIKSNERGILSLTISNYSYFNHAAHGLTVIKSLTFNINTGAVYSLAQLFKPGSSYVKTLSDIVGQQIKERDIPVLDEYKGIQPDQDYYIADKALVIYYQLYDLAPYAYGFPMFPISVYEIQDIILEDGPLGIMAISG